MPLEDAFHDFPLVETIANWSQPSGMCTTIATSWLKRKCGGVSFWAESPFGEMEPAKKVEKYAEKQLKDYAPSGRSGGEWAKSRFSQSKHEDLRAHTGRVLEAKPLMAVIPPATAALTTYSNCGVLITIAGTGGRPHALAGYSEQAHVCFFDPNLGEIRAEKKDFETWINRFFGAWAQDKTYKNYAHGSCQLTTFVRSTATDT